MMRRFQRSVGLKLLRVGPWQLELWFLPADEVVPPHVHEHFTSRIVYLGGLMWFQRWRDGKLAERLMRWWDFGTTFDVRAGEKHAVRVVGWCGVFLNLERWNGKPTSAGVDIRVST